MNLKMEVTLGIFGDLGLAILNKKIIISNLKRKFDTRDMSGGPVYP